MSFLSFRALKTVSAESASVAAPLPPVAAGGAQDTLTKSAQNLLAHIPGEASGLYLMAVDAIDQPTVAALVFVFILALVLLILVRWAAQASRAVMITSIIAFLIWMLVLKKGLLYVAFPGLLPDPLGLILAVFYSTAVTILANSGKIK